MSKAEAIYTWWVHLPLWARLRDFPDWPFRSPLRYATCIEAGEHWLTEGGEK